MDKNMLRDFKIDILSSIRDRLATQPVSATSSCEALESVNTKNRLVN